VAEFASIGTNDLIQYLFALDRNNDLVASDFSPDHPALWSLIRHITQVAAELGRPLSVCGEIAGDVRYVGRFREMGVNTVSVSARRIPVLRRSMLNSTA